eukprot:TRINITY_DN1973_c0_g1_i1.p1 TRINITY_DN1973_c0_g1~~TRINITY_DN1973_c0_g1_i1.p1  ORF type:complete len:403 (+),score=104.79 TRINITY_DN1973_c0_g1_i1:965-2173(+)
MFWSIEQIDLEGATEENIKELESEFIKKLNAEMENINSMTSREFYEGFLKDNEMNALIEMCNSEIEKIDNDIDYIKSYREFSDMIGKDNVDLVNFSELLEKLSNRENSSINTFYFKKIKKLEQEKQKKTMKEQTLFEKVLIVLSQLDNLLIEQYKVGSTTNKMEHIINTRLLPILFVLEEFFAYNTDDDKEMEDRFEDLNKALLLINNELCLPDVFPNKISKHDLRNFFLITLDLEAVYYCFKSSKNCVILTNNRKILTNANKRYKESQTRFNHLLTHFAISLLEENIVIERRLIGKVMKFFSDNSSTQQTQMMTININQFSNDLIDYFSEIKEALFDVLDNDGFNKLFSSILGWVYSTIENKTNIIPPTKEQLYKLLPNGIETPSQLLSLLERLENEKQKR